jgi:hypothetical protein
MNKFKYEVIADNSGHWAGNQKEYGTFDLAKAAALDLAGRWMLVMKARVIEFDGDKTIEETEVFG